MTSYFLLGLTFAFAAAVQPGPFQTYLISQTLSIGLRRSAPGAFAPLLSDIPVATLVLIILTHIPAWFTQILQFIGGLFLLYLAYGMYVSWKHYNVQSAVGNQTTRQTVIMAAMVNLLNPNPYLSWSLVMGPLLLKAWYQAPADGIILMISFYATFIVVTLLIMLLFSGAKNLGPRVSRSLVGISAIAMAGLGVYELWMAVV